MGENVKQKLETEISVRGERQYTGAMKQVAASSKMAGGSVGSLTSILGPLSVALGGVAAVMGLGKIAALGSQFEDTRRVIAGTYATLGVSKDFNAGLIQAAGTMEQIAAAAAKLPGEAADYLNVYRMSLPAVQGAIGGTTTEMTAFTNQFTAVMSTLGVSAVDAGSSLSRALAQGRGSVDDMNAGFRVLIPFISKATEGTANHITKVTQFNALTQQQRGLILKNTIAAEGLKKMIDDAGSSWGSQAGTLASLGELLARTASSPLFDAMKGWLSDFNSLFLTSEGALTDTGRAVQQAGLAVSKYLVKGINAAIEGVKKLSTTFSSLASSPVFAKLMSGKGLAGMAGAVGGLKMSGAGAAAAAAGGGGAGAAAAAAAALPLVLLGMGLADFLTRTEAVNNVLDILGSTFGILSGLLDPLLAYFVSMSGLLGDVIAGALPGLLEGINFILDPLLMVAGLFMGLAAGIMQSLRPALMMVWQGFGAIARGLGAVLGPVIRVVGIILYKMYETVASFVVPIFDGLATAIGWLMTKLGELLSWIGKWTGKGADAFEEWAVGGDPKVAGGASALDGLLGLFGDASNKEGTQTAAENAAAAPGAVPAHRGGGKVHQDFRNSKFTVQQKFAEGFDPDRIAVAFASDIGRIGTQRLQSGFEPMFGVR